MGANGFVCRFTLWMVALAAMTIPGVTPLLLQCGFQTRTWEVE
jgi:hypothetical protein